MQNIKNFDIKKYASLSMLTLTDDERRKAEADMQALLSIANGILSFDESREICKSGGYHLDSLREDIPNESFNTADMCHYYNNCQHKYQNTLTHSFSPFCRLLFFYTRAIHCFNNIALCCHEKQYRNR